ncbi:MAG: hypothetical protein V3W04_13770 [Gammaproteobacteria bacterium]
MKIELIRDDNTGRYLIKNQGKNIALIEDEATAIAFTVFLGKELKEDLKKEPKTLKPVTYDILVSPSRQSLIYQVNEKLAYDWHIQGGVTMGNTSNVAPHEYMQAIVRNNAEENNASTTKNNKPSSQVFESGDDH